MRTLLFSFLLLIGLAVNAGAKDYADASRFESQIQKIEQTDVDQPPPEGAIVFIGSSSVRHWHKSIEQDLAPLTIVPRGFGGSNMHEATYFADRIVTPYKPRAVVLYEGDNDIGQEVEPAQIHEEYLEFVRKVRAELPDVRIYFISIKPSPKRWEYWPKMQETNALIRAETEKDPQLFYIDVSEAMLDSDGEPSRELFKPDRLHMMPAGYEVWTAEIKPVLMEHEAAFEPVVK